MTTHYIKLSNMQYPLYEGDIRLEHPEIREDQTHPNFPCPEGYALLEFDPLPDFNSSTHTTTRLPPAIVGGVWRVQWSPVRELTEAEKQQRIMQDAQYQAERAARSQSSASTMFENLNAPGEAPNVL